MSSCDYSIGDKVERHGLCGTVVEKVELGDGCVLTVELPDGTKFNWSCDQVTPC